MKTNKLPTAEELLNEKYYHIILEAKDTWINVGDIERAMIEFAKLHVEAALKKASKKAKRKEGEVCNYILINSICCYSLNKIK